MILVFMVGLVSDLPTGTGWNNRARGSFQPEPRLMSISSAPLIGMPVKLPVNPNGLIVPGARRFHLRLMRTKQDLNPTAHLEMHLLHDLRRNCILNDLIEFNWRKMIFSAVENSRVWREMRGLGRSL